MDNIIDAINLVYHNYEFIHEGFRQCRFPVPLFHSSPPPPNPHPTVDANSWLFLKLSTALPNLWTHVASQRISLSPQRYRNYRFYIRNLHSCGIENGYFAITFPAVVNLCLQILRQPAQSWILRWETRHRAQRSHTYNVTLLAEQNGDRQYILRLPRNGGCLWIFVCSILQLSWKFRWLLRKKWLVLEEESSFMF